MAIVLGDSIHTISQIHKLQQDSQSILLDLLGCISQLSKLVHFTFLFPYFKKSQHVSRYSSQLWCYSTIWRTTRNWLSFKSSHTSTSIQYNLIHFKGQYDPHYWWEIKEIMSMKYALPHGITHTLMEGDISFKFIYDNLLLMAYLTLI